MKRLRLLALGCACTLSACAHASSPSAATALDTLPEALPVIEQDVRAPEVRAIPTNTHEALPPAQAAATGPHGVDFSSFELPVHYNDRVEQYIQLYAQEQRSTFAAWLRCMGRYGNYVADRLAAHGLPRELMYLPLIESHYDPTVGSPAGAAGLWQFMPGTARVEGLEVSRFLDERRDPLRSTDAAIRHLARLYDQFGSWYFALAAYNAGSHRVARLLKQAGMSKGADDMFWKLQQKLPRETRNYLPRLLAAIVVGEYAALFGIEPVIGNAPVEFEVIEVEPQRDLRDVARELAVSYEEIRRLNPHFIRGATPPGRTAQLRIPKSPAK